MAWPASDNFTSTSGLYPCDNGTHTPPPHTHLTQASSTNLHHAVGIFLIKYPLPVVIVLGTVGNVLSFLVLVKRRMRQTSVYVYLAMLACADTVVLYLSGFKTWIRLVTGTELLHVSGAVCKATMLVFLVALHMSAWLIVAVTADRFLAVTHPLQVSRYCTTRRATYLGAALLSLALVSNAHVLWTIHLYPKPPSGAPSCSHYPTDVFMETYYPYIKLSTYCLLPFTVVLILNTSITYKLWRSRQALLETKALPPDSATAGVAAASHGGKTASRAQRRITVMLLVVSFIWLGLSAPFMLYSLVRDSSAAPDKASLFLFKAIGFFLMYCNHSVNFYIYCCTGRKFRQELRSFCLRASPSRFSPRRSRSSRGATGATGRSTLSRRSETQRETPEL